MLRITYLRACLFGCGVRLSCRICSGGDSSAGEAVVREGGGSGGGGFGGGSGSFVPFLLVLGKDLALGVVADNLDVDEAA